jgi:hypothetical protein
MSIHFGTFSAMPRTEVNMSQDTRKLHDHIELLPEGEINIELMDNN